MRITYGKNNYNTEAHTQCRHNKNYLKSRVMWGCMGLHGVAWGCMGLNGVYGAVLR